MNIDPNTRNPFTSDEHADFMVRSALGDLMKLTLLTTRIDEEATTQYAGLVSVAISRSLGNGPEDLEGLYAQFWTLGLLINSSMDDDIRVSSADSECGHESCAREHKIQAAFIEPAARGDMDAAINAVRSAVVLAHAENVEPWRKLTTMLVSIMGSLADSMLTEYGRHGQNPEQN